MNEKSQRFVILRSFLLIGLIIYLFYSLFLQNTNELRNQIQSEIQSSRTVMPSDKWKLAVENTENAFNILVNHYGLTEYINQWLLPDDTKKKSSKGINFIAEKFISFNYTAARNIPLLIFQSLYRWFLILGWAVAFIPFLMAMFYDGMCQWKLKRYEFGKVTIQFYRIWFKAFMVISFLAMMYLLLPNLSLFNGVAQLFPPLALIILGIAINRLWANYQKLM